MKKSSWGSDDLFALLNEDVAYEERAILARQYIDEIDSLLEEKRAEGAVIFWKDLPWVIQFWPVISYFFEDRELINFLNPCPEVGGMSGVIGYSKSELHDKLPDKYMPKVLNFDGRPEVADVLVRMKDEGMGFPVFCKPDKGERAALVRRVVSREELAVYLEEFPDHNSLIVQAPAGGRWGERYEYGVQVVRNPDSGVLEITSAELKSVPWVVGDGQKTVEELVCGLLDLTDAQRENVLNDLSVDEKNLVLSDGEKKNVVHAASVSRGTKMVTLDYDFAGGDLERALCGVLAGIDNFSSGRFDLVSYSDEGLRAGDFEIIECNAGAAIPLQVYRTDLEIDEVYGILFAHFFRLKKNSLINRAKYEAGEIGEFVPLKKIQIAAQLAKGLLQQRSQWKSLAAGDTREMFRDILRKTRGERWALRRAKVREKIKKN